MTGASELPERSSVRSFGPRRVAAVLVGLVPLVSLSIAGALLGPALGPRMASHWGGGARPDGYAATWPSFWIFTGILVVLTAATLAAVFLLRRTGKIWAGLSTMLTGFLSFAWVVPALATAAASSPGQATLGWRMLLLLAPVACGVLVSVFVPSAPNARLPHPAPVLPPLSEGDRLVWTATTGSLLFTIPGALLLLIAAFGLGFVLITHTIGAIAAVIAVLLVGLSLLLMSQVRLSVDERGIRLVSVLFHIPLIRVRLGNIAAVTAETIEPMRWGGWGYRLSGNGLAYVVRKGPGLVVARRTGLGVAITIEHPEQAAAVAEALIERRAHDRQS